MILRRFVAPVVAATLVVAACKKAPPPPPAPMVNQDSIDAARRADSIARAEAAARAAAERAEAEARAARERAVTEARNTLTMMVHFDYDESTIRPDAADILRRKVEILRASPQVQLRITGNADERGSTEYNLALGNRRAEAVKDFLTGFGLAADRFTTTSNGEERPLVDAHNEEAWAQNRRAEFEITAGANAINPPM